MEKFQSRNRITTASFAVRLHQNGANSCGFGSATNQYLYFSPCHSSFPRPLKIRMDPKTFRPVISNLQTDGDKLSRYRDMINSNDEPSRTIYTNLSPNLCDCAKI
jgi:hypothetical protein